MKLPPALNQHLGPASISWTLIWMFEPLHWEEVPLLNYSCTSIHRGTIGAPLFPLSRCCAIHTSRLYMPLEAEAKISCLMCSDSKKSRHISQWGVLLPALLHGGNSKQPDVSERLLIHSCASPCFNRLKCQGLSSKATFCLLCKPVT